MESVVTDARAFRQVAADAPTGARIPVELQLSVADPFDAYRRARDDEVNVYLETTGGQPGWGYFGVSPVELLHIAPRANTLDGSGRPTLAAIEARLAAETLVRGNCDVPYPCGAVGWIAYDLAREIEDLPECSTDERGLPRAQLALFDTLASWEEPRESGAVTLRITACPRIGSDPRAAYDRGVEMARAFADRIRDGDPTLDAPPTRTERAAFTSERGRRSYAAAVRRVKDYIRDGDTFQANISHRLSAPAAVHPVAVYDALRGLNPAPYSALLELPGLDLVSASPELLVGVERDRVVTEPIAGTRPRGKTPAADADLETDLRTDEKERAEHAMLVDLERNDLGKICAYGSVAVSEYRRVDHYAEVMHLVSKIEGRLREGTSLDEVLAAVFPGGTITGAPKPRTMEIIEELETTRRGPYTGSIGLFGFDDRATLNITIRTLVRVAEEYHLRVGAGVVHDSIPDREYDETMDKARALVTAVDTALADQVQLEVRE